MATTSPTRIASLDITRGVAVMGILLLNIVSFGMPEVAYMNPRGFGGWQGADLWTWAVNFTFFDGRMRGLFSFLFGASMLLVIERAQAKGEDAARVHFRRMAVLLAFGLAHMWLVWRGDILSHYALVGGIAFLFRDLSNRKLIGWAVGLLVVELLLISTVLLAIHMGEVQLASDQADQVAAGREMMANLVNGFGVPPADVISRELAIHRGGYAGIVADRFGDTAFMPLGMLFQVGPETLAYMLLGMVAFRTGFLTGQWPRARYVRWATIGLGLSWPLYALLAAYMVNSGFDMRAVVTGTLIVPTILRPIGIVGWAALILLLARPGGALTERIGAAGRMAFSNYLLTSLICTTFFFGYGLGWFGWLSRAELYLVVAVVWAAMLLWSKPWLANHRYGPLEWVWRTLARGSRQPMRGGAAYI